MESQGNSSVQVVHFNIYMKDIIYTKNNYQSNKKDSKHLCIIINN